MLMLEDVRQFVSDLGIAVDDSVYMGKLDSKKEESIGVYNSKHTHEYSRAIGGKQNESYGVKYVTLLVHWDDSPRSTEKVACRLFEDLERAREVTINNEQIKFIQPLVSEPVELGTDDSGIYEKSIEVAIYYERKGE